MKNVLITINYNDYETTKKFVKSIIKYNIVDEIIVVDNNSSDNSFKELSKIKNYKVTLIRSDINGGYGYGNNLGIKYSISKYKKCNIIISNPDVIVSYDTIKSLLDTLNSSDSIAAVGPRINTNGIIEKAWKLTNGFQEMLLSFPFLGTKLKDSIIGYKKYKAGLNKVDVVSGCFFVIKSDVLEKINYYDENIFLYYEENVLCKKIKNLNMDVIFDNASEVIHSHSISINKNCSTLNKFKILKESQMYYLNHYTNASFVEKKIIQFLTKLMIIIKK